MCCKIKIFFNTEFIDTTFYIDKYYFLYGQIVQYLLITTLYRNWLLVNIRLKF